MRKSSLAVPEAEGEVSAQVPDLLHEACQAAGECIDQLPDRALKILRSAEAGLDSTGFPDGAGRYCKLRAQAHLMLCENETGESWAHRALKNFEQSGNQRGQVAIYNSLGIAARARGDYASSFDFLSRCLELARELDFTEAIGHAANNIALDLTYIGDLERALEYYQVSLQAWSKKNDPIGVGMAYLNLGLASSELGKPERALKYFEEATVKFYEDNYLRGVVVCLRNSGSERLKLGQLSASLRLFEEALELVSGLNEPVRRAHVLDGYALGLIQAERLDEAKRALDEAGQIYEEKQDPRGIILVEEAKAELLNDQPESARNLLLNALDRAAGSELKPQMASIHKKLAELCKRTGNWQQAFEHLEQSHELQRGIITKQAEQKAQTSRTQHELATARQEAEIERLKNVELAEALRELEKQRELASEQSRQKSEILNIAAHDLRSMLGGVLGSAKIAREATQEGADRNEIAELIESVLTASHNLEDTLLHILDASAIESGSISLDAQLLDIGLLARSVVADWRGPALEKNQSMQLHADGEFFASADPIRAGQVLSNLISNAVKYTRRGGAITVELGSEDGGVCCRVLDEGPGLSDADKAKLFRAFQRLTAKPTAAEGGTGLGLFIAKKLMDLHGGRLAYHRRTGGGSCFQVWFPRRS